MKQLFFLALFLAGASIVCAQPGALDLSFGINGLVQNDYSPNGDYIIDIAVLPNGDFIVAGVSNGDLMLAKYNASGALVTSFGANGVVVFDVGGVGSDDAVEAVGVQSSGKIIVSGWRIIDFEASSYIVRFNSNGTRDLSFGNSGYVIINGIYNGQPYDAYVRCMDVQSNNKIVVGTQGRVFGVRRYNADGTPDITFNGTGEAFIPLEPDEFAGHCRTITTRSDGKIVASGVYYYYLDGFSRSGNKVVRFNLNGSLDTSFDSDGQLIIPIDWIYYNIWSLIVQSDNTIIYTHSPQTYQTAYTHFVTKLLPNGTPDPSFGVNGETSYTVPSNTKTSNYTCCAIQPDGKILVGGSAYINNNNQFYLHRFNANGVTDFNFGNGGSSGVNVSIYEEWVNCIAIHQTDRVILAGSAPVSANDDPNTRHAISRHLLGCVSGPTLSASFTNAGCSQNNGSASVIATGGQGYTYQWSNGTIGTSIQNLGAGTYTVTVTISGGCSSTATVSITAQQAATLAIQKTDATCGQANGAASVSSGNGIALTGYNWSNGSHNATATLLSAGQYTVTATDVNGCSVTATASIANQPLATLTLNPQPTTCGGANGSVITTVSGGVPIAGYSWSNGSSFKNLVNVTAGTYTVTAIDANGCAITAQVVVPATPVISLVTSKINASCSLNNGAASVLSQNGVGIHDLVWSNGATTASISGLSPGVYGVTVTDVNGCQATASATVSTQPIATLNAVATPTTCGNQDGKVTVTVSGGAAIIGWLWSNGATTQNLNNAPGGFYTVVATDANGCQITAQATVVGLLNPVVNLGPDITLSPGQHAVLNAAGTGLTYAWSTDQTTATINVQSAGTYTVTVTNSSGCTASDSVQVNLASDTKSPEKLLQATLSPNPTGDVLWLQCEEEIALYRILDFTGRTLQKQFMSPAEAGRYRIDTSQLPTGAFVLQIHSGQKTAALPFVKQ